MQTITIEKTVNVYTLSELSEDALDNVYNNYVQTYRTADEIRDIINERLKYLFPNSDLDVYFDVSYCQGDCFEFTGKFWLSDILYYVDKTLDGNFKAIFPDLTEKEWKFIRFGIEEFGGVIEFRTSNRSYFGVHPLTDFEWTLDYDMNSNNFRGIRFDALEKFDADMCDFFEDLAKEFYRDAEDYFYNVEPSEIKDVYTDTLFTEDGEIFNGNF